MGEYPKVPFPFSFGVDDGHSLEFGEADQVYVRVTAQVLGSERNRADEPGCCGAEATANQSRSAQMAHIQGPKYCLQQFWREGLECTKAAREYQSLSDVHVWPTGLFI
jgi:hypothetical protein